MDEDEIDQWYEDEKQKAMDAYLKDLEIGKNHEGAEKIFNIKMDHIIKKYNDLMKEKIDNRGKSNKFKEFISDLTLKLKRK